MLTLKKTFNAVAYHAVNESVAMGVSMMGHIRPEDNEADFLTKVVMGQKKRHLVLLVFYDIYDGDT